MLSERAVPAAASGATQIVRPPAAPARKRARSLFGSLGGLLVAIPIAMVLLILGSVTAVPSLLGWQSFVVTSASMTPTIPVGSVAVVNPGVKATMQVGDIGTFFNPESGLRVTHRVIGVTERPDGIRVYESKGDATSTIDAPRLPENVVGKVMYWMPYVGYAAVYANSPQYRTPLVVLVVVLGAIWMLRGRSSGRPGAAAAPATEAGTTPVVAAAAPIAIQTATVATDQPAAAVTAAVAVARVAAPPAVLAVVPPVLTHSAALRRARRIFDGVIFAAGVAAVAMAAAVFVPLAFELRPFALPDTTMEPALRRGSLLIAEKANLADLQKGDIIIYSPAQERNRAYTRRVDAVEKTGQGPGDVKITTKADALLGPDAYTLSGAQTVGRVRFAIPLAGNVLALAGRREGMIALGGIAVLVLFGRSMARPRSPAA